MPSYWTLRRKSKVTVVEQLQCICVNEWERESFPQMQEPRDEALEDCQCYDENEEFFDAYDFIDIELYTDSDIQYVV